MTSSPSSNLLCYLYGHNFFRKDDEHPKSPIVICKNCKQTFEFNESGEIVQARKAKFNSGSKALKKYRKSG